ncbi:MAG: aminoacyl-tRNA hydrolase [Polyangiaceae bacterium]
MILLVGLGNPGPRYESTRHNVGVRVVERVVEKHGGGPWRSRFAGRLASFSLAGESRLALCPETFMNESGRSVQPCAAFHKIEPEDILVVHDELDLPFGDLRLKRGGGDAGHRGLRSVSAALGTPDYVRLRVGIGRPPPDFRGDVADFVLEAFAFQERAALDEVLDRCLDAIELLARRGLSEAMNQVHQPKPR